jgi:hypothetical protein
VPTHQTRPRPPPAAYRRKKQLTIFNSAEIA